MSDPVTLKLKIDDLQNELTLAHAMHKVAVSQRDAAWWELAEAKRAESSAASHVSTFTDADLHDIVVKSERYNGAGRDTVNALVAEIQALRKLLKNKGETKKEQG